MPGGIAMDHKSNDVRQAYVAGQFYPGDARELRRMIAAMIAEAERQPVSETSSVWAVILPHAGYVYSGLTAVKTLLPLRGKSFRRVVVIAPSHRYPIRGLALTRFQAYQTPLGTIPVDTEVIQTLAELNDPLLQMGDDSHRNEHALEVELPLLQEMLAPDFKLIPLICGMISLAEAEHLAGKLRQLVSPDTLWVISSDFTHFGHAFDYVPFRDQVPERLRQLDLGAVELIRQIDAAGFDNYLKVTHATICGANPIKLLLALAKLTVPGAQGELCEYTTSGAITGDYSHCVSYAGMMFKHEL